MPSIRMSVLTIGSLAVVAVAVSAGQQADAPPKEPSNEKRLKELEDHYRQLNADTTKFREEVSKQSKSLHWLSQNLYRPGMILAYDGPLAEAEALQTEGWFVCDGREITDSAAAPRFKSQKTPTLTDSGGRFLKGSVASGKPVGSESVTTSKDGKHTHLLPSDWYHRGLGGGHFNGIDTKNSHPKDGNPGVQANGEHTHTVAMDPPAYTVIFLIYVREIAPKPKP